VNIQTGVTYLITTDNWFTAPDGRQYKAVFGTVHGTLNDEAALGIGQLLIAGCQIHYAVRTDTCNKGLVMEDRISGDNTSVSRIQREVDIYFADEVWSRQ
jgi:hypothetical protein